MKNYVKTFEQFANESLINEGTEELKAYDAIKAAMFKIKKALEPVLKKADEL
jgi:hypothetical protein